MGTNFVYNRVNVTGIPCLESRSITETATGVTFNFDPSPAVSSRFSGLIAIRITDTPTSTSLPVSFNVPSIAGTTIAVSTFAGDAATGAELEEGIHLVFYDRFNGILQLLV